MSDRPRRVRGTLYPVHMILGLVKLSIWVRWDMKRSRKRLPILWANVEPSRAEFRVFRMYENFFVDRPSTVRCVINAL